MKTYNSVLLVLPFHQVDLLLPLDKFRSTVMELVILGVDLLQELVG